MLKCGKPTQAAQFPLGGMVDRQANSLINFFNVHIYLQIIHSQH